MIRQIHNMKNVTVSFEKSGTVYVGVEKKVPLSSLQKKDRIPKNLPNGQRTDVIEIPKIRALAYCNQEFESCSSHGLRRRPLVAGLSYAPSDSGAATLGAIVKDNFDNNIVALTCNHVIGPVLGTGSTIPETYITDIGTVDMVQPSPLDGGVSPQDSIGNGKRAIGTVFGPSGVNIVDAAISKLEGTNLYLPGIQDLLEGGAFPFADKLEYFSGNTVWKVGRTTGVSIGEIYHTNVNVTSILGADLPDNRAYYQGTIMIVATSRFLSAGDSGSAVVCKIGGRYKIIGILFAGSADGLMGFVCHISDVATLLNVSAWDGTIQMHTSQTGTVFVDGLCYYDTGVEVAGLPSHAPDEVFSNCESCLEAQGRKTLFGNLI